MLPRSLAPLALAIALSSAAAQDVHVHVSPASHGTTNSTDDFPTIQMAMDHAPEPGPSPGKNGRPARLFVHISPGIYHERVIVTENRPDTTFLGEGPDPSAVVITASMNARSAGGTFFTETVRVDAPGFDADNLTFENAAGDTGQAVALANRSDRSIIKHCRILGHQDTLFADFGRQYYLDTDIEGTVDFIFGNAAAVFDRSEIHELSPAYLTAQSRTSPRQTTGFVILHSRITSSLAPESNPTQTLSSQPAPEQATQVESQTLSSRPDPERATRVEGVVEGPASPTTNSPTQTLSSRPEAQTGVPGERSLAGVERAAVEGPASPTTPQFFLGRPWRAYARTVVLDSELPATLSPVGWSTWKGNNNHQTAFYAEFGNTGPGASFAHRAPWSHQLTSAETRQYLPQNFLSGHDHWDPLNEAKSLP